MGQKIRLCLIAWVTAWLLVGCGQAPIPTDAGDDGQVLDTPPVPGKLSGRLTLDLGVAGVPILDAEPNDTIDYAQTVGQAQPGTTYVIQGEIGNRIEEDTRDSFRFITQQPVEVTFALEFSSIDLNLGVMNFRDFECAPATGMATDFSHCFSASSTTTETGSFTVDDVFDVVVAPRSLLDVGEYTLTLVITAGAAGSATAKAGSGGSGGDPGDDDPHVDPPDWADDPIWVTPLESYTPGTDQFALGEVLVSCGPAGNVSTLRSAIQAAGYEVRSASPSGWCVAIVPGLDGLTQTQQRRETLRALARLQRVPGVVRTSLNHVAFPMAVPDDPDYTLQWHLPMIGAEQAWNITTGDPTVVVAVLDTGIYPHPDLDDQLSSDRYDFVTDDSDPRESDLALLFRSSHGVYVSGVIGATGDNGVGVSGVNWAVSLMEIRVCDTLLSTFFGGGCPADAIAEGIRYAVGLSNRSGRVPDDPARILNLSLGGPYPNPMEEDAVNDALGAGALVVASAGNECSGLPSYPASFNGVVNVSAVNADRRLANYSNFGPTITIAAPGGEIYRLVEGSDCELDFDDIADPDGGIYTTSTGVGDMLNITAEYDYTIGTSFSSPCVAGVAALMLSVNPTMTGDQMRSILVSTAEDIGSPGADDQFGAGLVNAAAAVQAAFELAGGTPTFPVIQLTPESLAFNLGVTEVVLDVSNGGMGLLQIAAIETQQTLGTQTRWLYAYGVPGGVNTNVDSIVVKVDRRSLPPGRYLGSVVVQDQNRAVRTVPVTLDVGEDNEDVAGGEIHVIAVDPESNTTVAWTTTTPAENYEYRFDALPPGQYYVYAGSDGNGDGQLCEFGEVCGAHGTLTFPVMVTVTSSAETTDVNIALDYAMP